MLLNSLLTTPRAALLSLLAELLLDICCQVPTSLIWGYGGWVSGRAALPWIILRKARKHTV